MIVPPLKFIRPFLCVPSYRLSSLSSSLSSKTFVTRTSFLDNNSLQNPPNFQPTIVDQLLFSLRSEPISAVRVFEWSEKVLGFNHSVHSYCNLVHILLCHRMFSHAHQVFDKMLDRVWDLDVFEALHEDGRTYGTNPTTAYSFMIAGFCRNGRFNEGISVFLKMSKMGIDVAPYAFRIMLDSLAASRCVAETMSILDEMCSLSPKKLKQGFNVYEFAMTTYASNHLFEMALNFHQKMIDRGFLPNIIDCNKILKTFCKEEPIETALKYFYTIG